MLNPIHKEQGSTRGERELRRLVETSFFGLWSYASVQRQIRSHGRLVAHEVVDLAVVFGNDLVLFSEKDIAFSKHPDINVAWGRWFRESISESVTQLRGAATKMTSGKHALFLDTKCEHPLPFDLSRKGIRVHLVAICRNSAEAARNYFAKYESRDTVQSSTGTLTFHAGLREQDMRAQPFAVGDFDPSKTFVHVLDEESVQLLMTELDTGPDFLDYLKVRERAVRKQSLRAFHGEEDFLSVYLQNEDERGFGGFSSPVQVTAVEMAPSLFVTEHMWTTHIATSEYQVHREVVRMARPWKETIDEFSKAILSATVAEGQDQPFPIHERAIRMMASENRVSRAALARMFEGIFRIAHASAVTVRITKSLCSPSRLYIFLLHPRVEWHSTYEEYRQDRHSWMDLYARCVQVKFPEYSEIVVFATDTKGTLIRSESVVVVEACPDMPEEMRADTLKTMKEMEIFTGKNAPSRDAAPPYVDIAVPEVQTSWTKSPGANEPCPCGSGKKYKKCCRA